jgi:hypothetical protein
VNLDTADDALNAALTFEGLRGSDLRGRRRYFTVEWSIIWGSTSVEMPSLLECQLSAAFLVFCELIKRVGGASVGG